MRSTHLNLRCERGEVYDDEVRYVSGSGEYIRDKMRRVDLGHTDNLEGYSHRGIVMEGRYLYKNPYAEKRLVEPCRLSDDEIAMADCLLGMKEYVESGKSFYSPADAFHDAYLAQLAQDAVETGQILQSESMPWMK